MALVNVRNILVIDNPTQFGNPFQFEITFDCLQNLDDDLEWKVIYVGSADDVEYDQVLEEVAVGPVPVGINRFVLQSDGPDANRIPQKDIRGVTVVLITCSYKNQEFIRVGYYLNNDYGNSIEIDEENPPPLDISILQRYILADEPRVTRFPIDWGNGVNEGNNSESITNQIENEGGSSDMNGFDNNMSSTSQMDHNMNSNVNNMGCMRMEMQLPNGGGMNGTGHANGNNCEYNGKSMSKINDE